MPTPICCMRYCKFKSSTKLALPIGEARNNFWCKPRNEKHRLAIITIAQVRILSEKVAVPWPPRAFPSVLIKTPTTTTARETLSGVLKVSMPQATAVAADVMGSAALIVSTKAADELWKLKLVARKPKQKKAPVKNRSLVGKEEKLIDHRFTMTS